jgi:large subunit ribosomal protein L5e
MKGANDGGLFVPHSESRFPGYKVIKAEAVTNKRGKKVEEEAEKAKTEFNPAVHKDHILGKHVQTYYDLLKKGDANVFKRQFSQWTKCLETSKAKTIMDLYTKAHASIRSNPDRAAKKAGKPTRNVVSKAPALVQSDSKGRKWLRNKKTSTAAKKERIAALIAKVKAAYGN